MIRQFCRHFWCQRRLVSYLGKTCHFATRGQHETRAHRISSLCPNIHIKPFSISSALHNEPVKAFNPIEQVDPDVYHRQKSKNYTVGRNVEDLIAIRNHPAYRDLFFHYDPLQVENDVKHSAVKNFIAIARSADGPVSEAKYRTEVDTLLSSLGELNDLEFQYVLYHLRLFIKSRTAAGKKQYEAIWKPLDEECIRRGVERKKWRAPVTFVYANLWDFLLLGRQSTFHWIFIKICIRKVDSLSREKFVRLCQSICKAKKLPKDIKLFNLQYNVGRIVEETERNGGPITPEELCAICCVFYKMKYPFHDREAVTKILDVVIRNSKTISNSSLSGICNGISISKRLIISDKIEELLNIMVPEVPRLDMNSCASLLILASRNRVRNKEILAAIAERLEVLKDTPEEIEVHHVDWLATAYQDLDSPSSPAFKTILSIVENCAEARKRRGLHLSGGDDADEDDGTEDAEKIDQLDTSPGSGTNGQKEIEDVIAHLFQKRLASILHSLAYGGIYPRTLISKALSLEYLDKIYGKRMHAYTPEILRLDMDVAEDLADYDGPRLSTRSREFLTKSIMTWVPPVAKLKVPAYESMARNVLEICTDILGHPSHVHLCNLVPHFGTIEAVFCTTKSGDPIKVPESFKLKNDHDPKTLLQEDLLGELQYHAIIMYYWDTLIGSTDEPVGSYRKLKEKIDKMGYKTYEISHNSWRLKSKEEINELVKTKLHDVLIKMPKTDVKENVSLQQ